MSVAAGKGCNKKTAPLRIRRRGGGAKNFQDEVFQWCLLGLCHFAVSHLFARFFAHFSAILSDTPVSVNLFSGLLYGAVEGAVVGCGVLRRVGVCYVAVTIPIFFTFLGPGKKKPRGDDEHSLGSAAADILDRPNDTGDRLDNVERNKEESGGGQAHAVVEAPSAGLEGKVSQLTAQNRQLDALVSLLTCQLHSLQYLATATAPSLSRKLVVQMWKSSTGEEMTDASWTRWLDFVACCPASCSDHQAEPVTCI